jgi:spore germination cell wall hydrolase CwlJ-like protein
MNQGDVERNEAKSKKKKDVIAAVAEKNEIHLLAAKIHSEAGGAPSENWIEAERIVTKE